MSGVLPGKGSPPPFPTPDIITPVRVPPRTVPLNGEQRAADPPVCGFFVYLTGGESKDSPPVFFAGRLIRMTGTSDLT